MCRKWSRNDSKRNWFKYGRKMISTKKHKLILITGLILVYKLRVEKQFWINLNIIWKLSYNDSDLYKRFSKSSIDYKVSKGLKCFVPTQTPSTSQPNFSEVLFARTIKRDLKFFSLFPSMIEKIFVRETRGTFLFVCFGWQRKFMEALRVFNSIRYGLSFDLARRRLKGTFWMLKHFS